MKKILFAILIGLLLLIGVGLYIKFQYTEPEETTPESPAVAKDEPNQKLKVYDSPEEKAKIADMLKKDQIVAPRTKIHFQILKVEGALSKVDAERSYLFQQASIKNCYLNALSDDQSLSGLVHLHFEADPKGVVKKATHDSEITHSSFLACLQETLDAWHFAPSSDDSSLVIDATLELTSGKAPTPEEIFEQGYH